MLSVVLFAACLAALAAMVNSLALENTLAAIEAAFGSAAIAVFLFFLGHKTFKAGKSRLVWGSGHNGE